MIIHIYHDSFKEGVAEDISYDGRSKSYKKRSGGILGNQLTSCISRGTKGSNGFSLFFQGVFGGCSENKGDDDHNDIEEGGYHYFVASHVFSGENYGLIIYCGDVICDRSRGG